jgi:hypothetical protein
MQREEREFWLKIRRGLLTINDAIEARLQVGKYEPEERSLARRENRENGRVTLPSQRR